VIRFLNPVDFDAAAHVIVENAFPFPRHLQPDDRITAF